MQNDRLIKIATGTGRKAAVWNAQELLWSDFVQKLVEVIPAWLTDGLNLGSKFLTAYGIALLLSSMLNRDLTVYFLLGFFLVGYIGLNITAIAIFACILAFILTGLKFRGGAAAAAGGVPAADDYDPLEDDL